MGTWTKVKWTQAGQIAELIERPGIADLEASPETGYRQLRTQGDLGTAVRYLAHALPRVEAIAWAAQLLDERSRATKLLVTERQSLDRTIRWLEQPTDEYRRAAFEAAGHAPEDSPERLLAYAVFMSGGSISEPDLPAVQPQQHVCGQLAAAAVLTAAYRSPAPDAALSAACDLGDRIASDGAKAPVRE